MTAFFFSMILPLTMAGSAVTLILLALKMREDGEPVTVKKGDVIATVGRSGLSTGPHLHFEVLIKGKAIDPELCLK